MGWRQRCSGPLALAAAALAAAPAAAQITTLQARTVVDGDFTISVLHPNRAAGDDVSLLCGWGEGPCVVFNRDMCAADYQPNPIRLALTAGSSTQKTAPPGSTSVHAYAWVQQSSLNCSNFSPDGVGDTQRWPAGHGATQQTYLLPKYQILTTGGQQALNVPGEAFDLAPADFKALTDRAIFDNFPEPCSEDGVPPTRWRLCIGVDYGTTFGIINNPALAGVNASNTNAASVSGGSTTGTTGGTGSITPTAWMEFLVATQRAAAPTVTGLRELFRRVELTLEVANPSSTLRDVVVRASSDPAVDPNDCNRWPSEVSEEVEMNVSAGLAAATDVTISVPGDNGVAYRYCAFTRDIVGNLSQPAPPVSGSPQLQADPFAAVGRDLQGGYGFCRGQGSGPGIWPLTLAWPLSRWCARRLARRHRRQGPAAPPAPPSSPPAC